MERGERIATESTGSPRLLNDKHAKPKDSAPAASDGIAGQRPESTTEEVTEAMSQPAGNGNTKKKTKMVRVKQAYIDYLLANPHMLKPYRPMSQELLDKADPELRDLMARVTARHDKIRNAHADFLEQYRIKGYAEEEIEVRDNEEEEEEDDPKAVGN